MAPSYKVPALRFAPPLGLTESPPLHRTMAPCFFMGLYPAGSPPSHKVVRLPDWTLPPLRANLDMPLFFNIAVTNLVGNARWLGFLDWLPPEYRPHSRSACTQGPLPEQPPN